jgi:hypothetical protein
MPSSRFLPNGRLDAPSASAPAGKTILPHPGIGPTIRYPFRWLKPTTGYWLPHNRTNRCLQSLLPLLQKQFSKGRPTFFHWKSETARPGTHEIREHHTPGNRYLIKAVTAASRYIIVLPPSLIPQVYHPCQIRIDGQRHWILLLGLYVLQLGPRR